MNPKARARIRTPALSISAGVLWPLALMLSLRTIPAQPLSPEGDYTIAVDVSRVVLDVTVYDKKGRLIPGLNADNFRLFEDGVEQKILQLAQEDRPLTLGLVVDSSRSIGESRPQVIEGAMRLAKLSHDQDDVFLVSFNDAPRFGLERDVRFTSSLTTLREALFGMRPEGLTALYDAVSMALDELSRGKWEREAAVIFSDGGDTASNATLEQTLEAVRRSNALVYAIGLASPENPYNSPGVLKKLANASGAEAFFPKTREDLQKVCEAIAIEMRSQYTMTYAPANPRQDGLYRKIEIELVSPAAKGWKVRAREGYYEPAPKKASQ